MFVNPEIKTELQGRAHYNSNNQGQGRMRLNKLKSIFINSTPDNFKHYSLKYENKKLTITFHEDRQPNSRSTNYTKSTDAHYFYNKTDLVSRCMFEDTFDIINFRLVKHEYMIDDHNNPIIVVTQILPDFEYIINGIKDKKIPKLILDNINSKYFINRHFVSLANKLSEL